MPPHWDYFARQHSYNWQKFDSAANHMEDRHFWPDVASWIERKYHDDRNPPVQIELFHHVAETPPPNASGFVQHDANDFKFTDKIIFTYLPETKQFQ